MLPVLLGAEAARRRLIVDDTKSYRCFGRDTIIKPIHGGYRVRWLVCITPSWGGFPSSISRQPRELPISNDTSWESSQRDASNADLLGTDGIPTVEMSTMGNQHKVA